MYLLRSPDGFMKYGRFSGITAAEMRDYDDEEDSNISLRGSVSRVKREPQVRGSM